LRASALGLAALHGTAIFMLDNAPYINVDVQMGPDRRS